MRETSHLITSAALGIALLAPHLHGASLLLLIAFAGFGGLFPDFDFVRSPWKRHLWPIVDLSEGGFESHGYWTPFGALRHRGPLHSLLAGALFGWIFGQLVGAVAASFSSADSLHLGHLVFGSNPGLVAGLSFTVGFWIHLLMDSINPTSMDLLFPLDRIARLVAQIAGRPLPARSRYRRLSRFSVSSRSKVFTPLCVVICVLCFGLAVMSLAG